MLNILFGVIRTNQSLEYNFSDLFHWLKPTKHKTLAKLKENLSNFPSFKLYPCKYIHTQVLKVGIKSVDIAVSFLINFESYIIKIKGTTTLRFEKWAVPDHSWNALKKNNIYFEQMSILLLVQCNEVLIS